MPVQKMGYSGCQIVLRHLGFRSLSMRRGMSRQGINAAYGSPRHIAFFFTLILELVFRALYFMFLLRDSLKNLDILSRANKCFKQKGKCFDLMSTSFTSNGKKEKILYFN